MTVVFSPRDGALRATPAPATVPSASPPCHDARRLTGNNGTATILLDGQPYVLRITRAGKLILTK